MLHLRIAFALMIAVAAGTPAGTAGAQQGTASLVGHLVNRETRSPIEGATVVHAGTGATTTSDVAGQFRYGGLSLGDHELDIRAIGYAHSVWRVRLQAGEQVRVFELDIATYELPGVVVEVRGKLAEFERRRAHGMGFFFTRDEIERRHARSLSDLMRGVPGVHTTCGRGSCVIQMSRSPRGCRPEYYLDGFPASFSVGPDFPLTGIYGVEVYRTASEAPTDFRKPELRCGVILIWSDMGR